jgi:hypothetical protein
MTLALKSKHKERKETSHRENPLQHWDQASVLAIGQRSGNFFCKGQLVSFLALLQLFDSVAAA